MTEGEVIERLRSRYAGVSGNGPKWAFVPQVRNGAAWGGEHGVGGLRTCDAMALALWPSMGLELHGHEVKCSRGDWLRELKDPDKADAFRRYCDRWWLVTPPGVVRGPDEIPPGWGVLVVRDARVNVAFSAPTLSPEPLPRGILVALVRAAIRNGSLGGPQ